MISINRNKVELNLFPDKTLRLSFDKDITADLHARYNVIEWYYEGGYEFEAMWHIVHHIREIKDDVFLTLELPYIPNARMDRIKDMSEVFTLKYFAEFINTLHFNRVFVYDPHSHVSEALLNHIRILDLGEIILPVLNKVKPDIIFFPDEGSKKRYADIEVLKEKPAVFGIKNRDWKTGEIKSLGISGDGCDIKDAKILIVDDICSRGGTFYHSAKRLKELGAGGIYLWVTHCENTILDGDILESGLVERVFTTNSIFTKEHEKIEVTDLHYVY